MPWWRGCSMGVSCPNHSRPLAISSTRCSTRPTGIPPVPAVPVETPPHRRGWRKIVSEINDIIQVRIRALFDKEPVVNTLTFAVVDAQPTWVTQVQGLRTGLDMSLALEAGDGPWVHGLSVQYVQQRVDFIDVWPGTNPMLSYASAGVGNVTDEDAMPPNDCLCATLRSEFRGQGARGRIYFTGFAEGSANGGYWEAGAQTYATGVLDLLLGNFGPEGGQECRWIVAHRLAGGVRLAPPEIKPIVSYTVHNEVRSLGRRAVGRRIHRRRPGA